MVKQLVVSLCLLIAFVAFGVGSTVIHAQKPTTTSTAFIAPIPQSQVLYHPAQAVTDASK